ncbi:MAG: hypothetical protein ACU0BS_02305 [Hasllibacter sp.]
MTVATIQHEIAVFTLRTDAGGSARVRMPALAVDAEFYAFLPDGAAALAELRVGDAARYDRVGVLLPAGARAVLAGAGDGTTFELGDPAGPEARSALLHQRAAGTAGFGATVEIEVTDRTCGRDLEALILSSDGRRPARMAPVTVAMPDCDGLGGFVTLNAALLGSMLPVR